MDSLMDLGTFFLGTASGALLTRIARRRLQPPKACPEASAHFARRGE